MTKRQAKLFFYASTAVFVVVFVGLTVDTHRRVPVLTHSDQLTPVVLSGKEVWHARDCTNCHTLLGEGAYYGPDLTKIAQQRGPDYLKAFLAAPEKFYSEERDRRLMPNLRLSSVQIDGLIAFLDWVSRIDTQGWPPRPLLVSGSAVPGANPGAPPPAAASTDPVAQGQALFRSTPPGCSACHSTAPGVNIVGPSLAGIGTRAGQRVRAADYHGKATDAAGYIRESILDPNAYVVQGPTFSSGGRSLMPANFAQTLQPGQVDELVAYLMTLR